MKNTVFFQAKNLVEILYLLITEKFCLELCIDGKYGLFLSVHGKMIFTNYWKAPVLNFSKIENMVFFEPKSWWKDDIYQLLKSSCFELFGDRKYGLFFSQKIDGKMIFTCYHCFYILYFSAFSDFRFFHSSLYSRNTFSTKINSSWLIYMINISRLKL